MSKTAILAGCMVGLAAAAYGIYSITVPDGNNEPVGKVQVVDKNEAGENPAKTITKALAAGKLAAFVIHPKRKPVAEVQFSDEGGKTRNLGEWRGRVVLLNLWATWCGPCRQEMPELAQLQKDLGGDDFEVIALSVDRKGAEASAAFLIEADAANLKLYVDPSADAISKLQAIGLPATLLIDRNGNEVGRMFGPAAWASEDAKRLIETAIQEGR